MDPITIGAALTSLLGLFKGEGSNTVSSTGLPPELNAELLDLIRMQNDRAQRTTPIHQAAMAMASRLAPGYARDAMTGSGSSSRGTVLPPSNSGLGASSPVAQVMSYLASSGIFGDPLSNGAGSGGSDPFLLGSPSLGRRGPGLDPRAYDPVGLGWRAFFSGNPSNAFTGGGVTGGGGEQITTGGGRDRARAY